MQENGKVLTVLVVDDEPDLVEILTFFLEDLKYHVLSAYNGEDAIELYDKNQDKIDVIISDIVMPKLDGIAMTKRIKEKYSDSPIIILASGYSEINEIKCIEAGAYALLTKPIDPIELAKIIRGASAS